MRKNRGLGLKLDIQTAQANLDEELQARAPKLSMAETMSTGGPNEDVLMTSEKE